MSFEECMSFEKKREQELLERFESIQEDDNLVK